MHILRFSTEHEPLRSISSSQREALEDATAAYQAQLTADAAAYLLARGLDLDMVDTYRLGVVADPMPGHEQFHGFLAIPYLDKDGVPLSVRFRCLEEHDHRARGHGKYMSVPDEPVRLYNVRAIHQAASAIHLAEGEFDTIVLNMVGLSAVGLPGAKNWIGRHRRMLASFSRVWVWGDSGGAELVNKVTRSLRNAKGVRLCGGDVTDLYLASGAAALRELVED